MKEKFMKSGIIYCTKIGKKMTCHFTNPKNNSINVDSKEELKAMNVRGGNTISTIDEDGQMNINHGPEHGKQYSCHVNTWSDGQRTALCEEEPIKVKGKKKPRNFK